MSPRGRRPGGEDTRGAIVEAARAEFAEQGYEATSLRGIARRASVDPALVHHYFEGKPGLFAEVMSLPVDPTALVDRILAAPRDQVGEALVRAFLTIWDSPEGRPRFQALMRSALSHEEAARMLREFLVREVFGRVGEAFAAPGPDGATTPTASTRTAITATGAAAATAADTATAAATATGTVADVELRASLAAAQMVGVGMMRYVLELPAAVQASQDDLVALLAPVLQRHLVPEV
ncbi:MAG TPA: TetR family transcriptional regulator [Pedococcus sp.]